MCLFDSPAQQPISGNSAVWGFMFRPCRSRRHINRWLQGNMQTNIAHCWLRQLQHTQDTPSKCPGPGFGSFRYVQQSNMPRVHLDPMNDVTGLQGSCPAILGAQQALGPTLLLLTVPVKQAWPLAQFAVQPNPPL
eukprot:GHUV01031491.1.p2 GENE.GHUV01031491.1~~GHUV01031491.1.p2  ORF type:complete len:135 (+),score=23.33 GHUV01031491.1:224-628(+)